MESPDLKTEFAGVSLANPVLLASGTCGYGSEFEPFLDLRELGGLVAKSLTLEPRFGNKPTRITETPAGMLNAISLENVGVEAFLNEKLPALPDGIAVIASAFETEIDRYAEVCRRLDGAKGVAAIEINASCPHVKAGGIEFGQDPKVLASLVRSCRGATRGPLIIKLSPNVTSIAEMARVCEAEGADGVALINAVQGLMVDVRSRKPVLRNILGGLSGPAILPIALRMVYQVSQAVGLPICGIGGISSAEDAIAFILCGASAVQVGTISYTNPGAALEIRDGISAYCQEQGVAAVRELIGALELPPPARP
ncbi:MAG: dihydroorotate dehydrogenase [bacterium]|nr:dihydroorotate dehydrogenase [bacterium]